MPISGLVVTLGDCPRHVDAVLAKLRMDPRVTLGERVGPLQPIVIDASDRDEDRRLRESLHDLDGIIKAEVVFVHFDEGDYSRPEPMGSSDCSSLSEAGGNRQSSSKPPEVASC